MGTEPIKNVSLEHLYHGYLVESGRPTGAPQLIACSPGVAVGQWRECLALAPLLPAGHDDATGPDSDVIGLFHGQNTDYILAHARREWIGESAVPTVHYILLPRAVLDILSGNINVLQRVLQNEMPTFNVLRNEINPYLISDLAAPTTRQQMSALTTLLSCCQNVARTTRGLLGTIVLGEPLAIINCNAPIAERLHFLQGLLSLLPPPARSEITFVSYVSTGQNSPAQIKFLARGAVPPEKHQVFNWEAGELTTTFTAKEPYSSFAVGRMQLDPIDLDRRLNDMADTARHYMDVLPLAAALAEVARRAVMDIALAEGQPLYREDVMGVLQTDPTLRGDLRVAYAEYLLRVTLALDEPEPADVLVSLIEEDRTVAVAVFKQLERAAREGRALPAFTLLKRWFNLAPEMAESWPRIFGVVALAYQRELAGRQDSEGVAGLLEELETTPVALEFDQVMDKILQTSLPLARKNSRIARSTLRLAAHHLEPRDFDRLLNDAAFVDQLPAPVQAALVCLDSSKPIEGTGRGVLLRAGKALGEQGDMVLARFAEHAVAIHRQELIDVPALESLRNLAQSRYAGRFTEILQQTVWALVRSPELTTLPEPGPLLLAQILFLLDRPADLAQLLLRYQHVLYGDPRLDEFRQLVRALFQVTPVGASQALGALRALEANASLDRHALALAYRSVLHVHDWDPGVEYAVNGLLALMDRRTELALTLGFPFTVELFRYVAEHGERADLLRVAKPLFDHLPPDAAQSAPVMRRIWPLLAQDIEMREIAIDLLRAYTRRIPQKEIGKLLRLYDNKRTQRERETLKVSLALYPVFRARDLLALAEHIKRAVDLFSDLIVNFEYNQPPHPNVLTRELGSLTGALSKKEIANLSQQSLTLADCIQQLGRAHSQDNTRESLIANQAVPRSGVGILYWLGGYFAEGDPEERDIDRHGLPHPFGNRSLNILYDEVTLTADLFADLFEAFPVDKPPALDLTALRDDIESRWEELDIFDQRRLQHTLARDCQTLASLTAQMAQTGGSTTFLGADVSKQVIQGKVAPQSVIDVLRWMGGFYTGKHPK
ncbi:MAG: hypothetical protein JXB47_17245 [Anaerolineae bacterium]|nr:hypothetical protein [Anaerolineae bacterium]